MHIILSMITEQEVALRLLISAILGAVIGFERERQSQPAGLRTHIILVMGAALASTLSINFAIEFRPFVVNGDPSRIAAQVISGIGFLGAGAILRYGTNIKGLTTATSLWTMAVVGLAVGAGHYISAIATTVLILIALIGISAFEKMYIRPMTVVIVTLTADDRPGLIADFRQIMKNHNQDVSSFRIQKNIRAKRVKVEATIKIHTADLPEALVQEVGQIKGLRAFKIG